MAKTNAKPKTARKTPAAARTKKAAKRSRPPRAETTNAARAEAPAKAAQTTARPDTKQAILIARLRRKDGATLADLIEATGWQAHSVRGAISGALKKKLGLAVTSEKLEDRGRVYRIVDGR